MIRGRTGSPCFRKMWQGNPDNHLGGKDLTLNPSMLKFSSAKIIVNRLDHPGDSIVECAHIYLLKSIINSCINFLRKIALLSFRNCNKKLKIVKSIKKTKRLIIYSWSVFEFESKRAWSLFTVFIYNAIVIMYFSLKIHVKTSFS